MRDLGRISTTRDLAAPCLLCIVLSHRQLYFGTSSLGCVISSSRKSRDRCEPEVNLNFDSWPLLSIAKRHTSQYLHRGRSSSRTVARLASVANSAFHIQHGPQVFQTVPKVHDEFTYESMRDPKSSRLLKVLPEKIAGLIQVDISEATAAVPHQCLSYTRGDQTDKHSIQLNNRTMQIGKNLFEFPDMAAERLCGELLWMNAPLHQPA